MANDKVYKDLFDVEGEVVIVTGGMGQLGREYTRTLVEAGARVAIFDIQDKVNDEISALVSRGLPVLICQADITKKEEISRAFGKVLARFGTPTVLINNAGIDITPSAPIADTGPFEDYPESTWDAVLDSHLKGMFLMSQEFLRQIKGTGTKGSIINISSTLGLVSPDQSIYDFRRKKGEDFYKPVTYSVAKSGVLNFTRWLAEYCMRRGLDIRVNTLAPGGVYAGQNEEFVKEYARRTILGRMANKDEYNAAVLFLASHKASSYMTGALLVVDGGWTAR